jgi:hypothetical protein
MLSNVKTRTYPYLSHLARYDHLVVHATATNPAVDADAAWVDRAHRARGWRGCGYHAVITRDGEWQDNDDGHPARPIGRQGAHVGDCGPGWNSRSFGVALAGGIGWNGRPENNYTPVQLATLARGIARFTALHPEPWVLRVFGHRDLIAMTDAPPKACPCFDVHEWARRVRLVQDPMLTAGTVGEVDEDAMATGRPSTMAMPETHVVRFGDSLWRMGQTYGLSVEEILALNPGVTQAIEPGDVLRLRRDDR